MMMMMGAQKVKTLGCCGARATPTSPIRGRVHLGVLREFVCGEKVHVQAIPIGKFGSTDASVGLVRISAWVSAERPSFICDYVQRKKAH